jgi:hypothetical protein
MNGLDSQILIISPEPWEGHFVSKHHYAITLAKEGYDVYFLNPPDNSLKNINVQKTKYENLWEVSAPQVAKGLRFYPKFLRNYLERKWLEDLESRIGKSFTTIWLFESSRFYSMGFAGKRTKIYHQVDTSQNFHAKEASTSADICFCVTDYIQRDLMVYNDNVFKISHGLSFLTSKSSLSMEHLKRFPRDSIHAVYIGNLDMVYINEDILYEIVLHHPKITFHFIGNYSQNGALYQRCKEMKNIMWWGSIDSALIPTILTKIDITLLIYRAEEYKEQLANSHKIMEYLASGKVTVATYTDEYKDKRELLEMVDDSSDYLKRFAQVANNLVFYNAEEKQKMRKEFARSHSYEKQLAKIVACLKEYNLEL